jgi:predicted DNA-binding ribbon-helix-helix protein
MCEFFVKADPILYESRSRTVRIHGVLTSIRLKNMCWDTLAEMAAEGCTTNRLIVTLHDEILAHQGEVPNLASLLRVTCIRYLRRKLDRGGSRSVLRPSRRGRRACGRSPASWPCGRRAGPRA